MNTSRDGQARRCVFGRRVSAGGKVVAIFSGPQKKRSSARIFRAGTCFFWQVPLGDKKKGKDVFQHELSAEMVLVALFGVAVYAYFLWVFCASCAFTGNAAAPGGIFDATGLAFLKQWFPFTIDGASVDSGVVPIHEAILVDVALLGAFGLQHLIMARKSFKDLLTRVVPTSAERSLFVLASSSLLHLMVSHWKPLPAALWSVPRVFEGPVVAVWGLGWLLVLLATFNVDHFELFGLRQSMNFPRRSDEIVVSYLYKIVRHPIMTGFLIGFWATPTMTQGHLLFCLVTTCFILFTVRFFEEPDLVRDFGEFYSEYRRQVPAYLPSGSVFQAGKSKSS
jgi:methanethiol S-methyltransferase